MEFLVNTRGWYDIEYYCGEIDMGVVKYLGGVGLYILGIFFIFIGVISVIVSTTTCMFFVIIGFIILLVGVFYARTSTYDVPRHIKIVDKKRNDDRRCPNCGRVIPLDARICPYCSKKFW